MPVSSHDRDVIRRLAQRQAQIAALPCHRRTIDLWRRMNDLQPVKPMVWINEICWHEFRFEPELALHCEDDFARNVEQELRRTIWQWEKMPSDWVVEPVYYVSPAVRDSGLGIKEEADIVRTDAASDVVSRHYHLQIQCEKDLEKIKTPVLTHDQAATDQRVERTRELVGESLRVELRNRAVAWFAPWDELIRWWGVEEAMTDMADRPELVRAAMDRLVGAYLARLDQLQELNLLTLNNNNQRIGSGGLGYCDDLPGPDFDARRVRTHNLWGNATAQIFSEISPAMHEEFALQFERRWLRRFGLTYYGCCEPLHLKLDILKSVPNLRKVSMSPKADLDKAVAQIGRRYVLSHKPNPAVFAGDAWHPEEARRQLRAALDKMRGCCVEVIMKDISTVRYEPRRLCEWAKIAGEVTAEYA